MKKIPSIKKRVRDFLNSEEGKITKKNAFKLGLGFASAGFILNHFTHEANAQCWPPANHTSSCGADCPTNYGGNLTGNLTNDGCPGYCYPEGCGSENVGYYTNYNGTAKGGGFCTGVDAIHYLTDLGSFEGFVYGSEYAQYYGAYFPFENNTEGTGVFTYHTCPSDFSSVNSGVDTEVGSCTGDNGSVNSGVNNGVCGSDNYPVYSSVSCPSNEYTDCGGGYDSGFCTGEDTTNYYPYECMLF